MQKTPSLSDHEASAFHTSNTEFFDGRAFSPICSWPGDIQHLFHKSEIGDTDTFKSILFVSENNMSPHLLLNFIFINTKTKEPEQGPQIHPPNTMDHSLHPWEETLLVLLRCHPIKISTFGWLPYPLKSLVHIHLSQHLPPFFYSFTKLPQLQRLLQKIPKSTPMAISATWTYVTSPTIHQLPRHQPFLRRNLKKNGKLYGRSSQSSQITPGILEKSLSPTSPLPTQATSPPITALPHHW